MTRRIHERAGRWTVARILAVAAATLWACAPGGDGAGEAARAGESASGDSLFSRLFREEPQIRTVPAGTLLAVRFEDRLSSHESQPGQAFRARVIQEVSVEGRVAIPNGTVVVGSVTEARPPRKIGGRAVLSLDFHALELPGGGTVPIEAAFSRRGKSQAPKDAAIIGGSTLGGAVLGEAVDEGEGTLIGALVGGVGGAIAAAKTKGEPVEVPVGTVMSLELTAPATVEVIAERVADGQGRGGGQR